MKKVNITLIVFCFVLLAAHFFRYGWIVLTAFSLVFPLLLLIKKPWAALTIQIALLVGTIEWIRTLVETVQYRLDYDQPWMRMAIILAIVAGLNFYASLSLQSKSLKKAYGRN